MSTSIDLPSAFAIVERANAIYAAAMKDVHALDDYDRWTMVRRSADSALKLAVVQIGAFIIERGDNTSIRLCGIRSTSTSGLFGAVRNWLNAARERLPAKPVKTRLSIKSLEIEVSGDSALVGEAVAAIGSALASFFDDPFNPHGSGPVPIEPREG